jgi:phosphonate transport system permease protein
VGRRGVVLSLIALAGLAAVLELGVGSDLWPSGDDFVQIRAFLGAALHPAFEFEPGQNLADGASLLSVLGASIGRTVVFATAAVSLSLVIGVLLGFPSSTAWWTSDPAGASSSWLRMLRRTVFPLVYGGARTAATLMRSVHELLWAVLFLSAFGLNDLAAVFAIAIPYGGTLAKIFSEMIDEAPRDAALALREAGAGAGAVFTVGLLPRALPDMTAYTLYRFECALRSAAVLGFFGWQTLGYHIELMWKKARYDEVWTFLYALILMVIVLDWWSGALRKRLAA